jgi:hypothetical protein
MSSLPTAQHDELLGKIRDGHDPESACAALGITRDQIAAGGDELKDEISEAFRAGTARLRGKIMEGALSSDNVGILMKLLEQRQATQEAQMAPEAADRMTRMEMARRILFMLAEGMHDDEERDRWLSRILRAKCQQCGQAPYEPKPTDTSPVIDHSERRLNSHPN